MVSTVFGPKTLGELGELGRHTGERAAGWANAKLVSNPLNLELAVLVFVGEVCRNADCLRVAVF